MRNFLAALLLFIASASAALAQPVGAAPLYCNRVAISATLTAGTTQLVAGVAGKQISFCGYYVDGVAAGSFQFVFGTGTSCTTPTAVSTVVTTAASQHNFDHLATAYASGNQGQSLCVIVTGTNSLSTTAFYTIN